MSAGAQERGRGRDGGRGRQQCREGLRRRQEQAEEEVGSQQYQGASSGSLAYYFKVVALSTQ